MSGISIEVVYACPDRQQLISLEVSSGTTARQAVQISRLGTIFPELDCASCPLGVFGAEVADDYVVQAGDRVEVYRPLMNDPRELRRELAKRGRNMGTAD